MWPEDFDFPGKVSQKKNTEEEEEGEEEEADNKENLRDYLPESVGVEERILPKSPKIKRGKRTINKKEK